MKQFNIVVVIDHDLFLKLTHNATPDTIYVLALKRYSDNFNEYRFWAPKIGSMTLTLSDWGPKDKPWYFVSCSGCYSGFDEALLCLEKSIINWDNQPKQQLYNSSYNIDNVCCYN